MGIRSRFARILSATTNRPDESKRSDHWRMCWISADEPYRRAFISQFPQVKAAVIATLFLATCLLDPQKNSKKVDSSNNDTQGAVWSSRYSFKTQPANGRNL